MTEAWFGILAVVILVVMVGAAASTAAGDTDGVDTAIEPPELEDATPPSTAGVATVNGESFDSVQTALEHTTPGDTIYLDGRFDERIVVDTPGVTIVGVDGVESALIDGGGEDTVIAIHAENVTIADLWVAESGYDRSSEDAGVFVDGNDATLTDLRVTDVTFGVWVNGAEGVTIEESVFVGRADVTTLAQRGNGIHLWEADGATVRDNDITQMRDGIYFAWAERVRAEGNAMWDLRYGVHYMYSSDNRLTGNVAYDNDIGFALMISQNLTIEDNVAVNNRGASGHGILIKDIDRSEIRGNHVIDNRNGLYVYNAQDNRIVDNLVMDNDRGIQVTAGTRGELVTGNSFIANTEQAFVDTRSQVSWNDSDRGNYWSDAPAIDLDGDGTSEVRHQPAGTVERLVYERPSAAVFAHSPAFDVIRLAESSFPVIVSPGAVDHHPLAEPNHDPSQYHAH